MATEWYKKCPECGKTKPESQFWWGARRCRSCVAGVSGERRARRAAEWRSHVREKYGLTIAISERQVHREHAAAHRAADLAIPKSARDAWAEWLAVCAKVAFVAGGVSWVAALACIAQRSLALSICLVLLPPLSGFVAAGIAQRLSAPREAVVRDMAESLLRERLKGIETERMEYLRFYTTSDWRTLRAEVIERDGRTCAKCGRKIRRIRDVTVDHILPRSLYPQRALDPGNLQVLCRSCNSAKGVSFEDEQENAEAAEESGQG